MCTHPIQIERRSPTGSVRVDVVPCGKCAECRAAYQSEFAVLCAVEADKKQSLDFYTLTYNDSWLPVNFIDYVPGEMDNFVTAYFRGDSCSDWQLKEWSNNGCDVVSNDDATMVCPSLRREDVKKWFKRFRSYCKRHDLHPDFSFACFGEYGERKHRPHYHILVAGLAPDLARILASMWAFGFVDHKKINRFNRDGTDAYVLISNYVSKYISKKDKLPEFVKQGFAEKPRRQTSIGFGSLTDDQIVDLRPFLSCTGLHADSCPRSASSNC